MEIRIPLRKLAGAWKYWNWQERAAAAVAALVVLGLMVGLAAFNPLVGKDLRSTHTPSTRVVVAEEEKSASTPKPRKAKKTPTVAAAKGAYAAPESGEEGTPTLTPTVSRSKKGAEAVVKVEALNVRTGPGTVYPRVARVKEGDRLGVKARNGSCTWLKVKTPGDKEGWVSADYVELNVACEELPVGEAPPTPTLVPSPSPTSAPASGEGIILFLSDQEVDFFSNPTLWKMNPDGSGRERRDDLWDRYYQALEEKEWSPGRVYRVYVGEDLQLHIYYPQDNVSWELTHFGAGIAYDPAFSPVDDRVVFVSNDSGNDEIWIALSARRWAEVRQLTRNSWEWDKFPCFSPDGTRIIFWSNRDGRRQIYVMNADGSNQHNISNSPYNDWDPVWVR